MENTLFSMQIFCQATNEQKFHENPATIFASYFLDLNSPPSKGDKYHILRLSFSDDEESSPSFPDIFNASSCW